MSWRSWIISLLHSQCRGPLLTSTALLAALRRDNPQLILVEQARRSFLPASGWRKTRWSSSTHHVVPQVVVFVIGLQQTESMDQPLKACYGAAVDRVKEIAVNSGDEFNEVLRTTAVPFHE